ncbi:MAG TPA: dual specificity protein phosphatase [Isosphaeraceae bacterium]|jgi:hypothetical protein|nr:dual specificity protein phosphatase [Isosphaeraceae bacterium]
MYQLPGYPLWIGHAGEGRDLAHLLDEGIEAIVQLASEEPPLDTPRDLIYCRFPLTDGADNPSQLLTMAAHTVAELLARRVPTFVCCSLGMSRSPVIVAAALALETHEAPEVCLKRVLVHHPGDVSAALWNNMFELLPSAH